MLVNEHVWITSLGAVIGKLRHVTQAPVAGVFFGRQGLFFERVVRLAYAMDLELDFARLIDAAPKVSCPRCDVEMTLRNLAPTKDSNEYTALYRCPQCGTDTQLQFNYRP